jgi:hypothetical protein
MRTIKLTDDQVNLVEGLLTQIWNDQTNFWETRGKGGYANSKLKR